jgi:pilus assembly protein TadC
VILLITVLALFFVRKPRALPLLRRRKVAALDVDATARLLLISVTAGLPLTAAMSIAADELESSHELRRLIRRARRDGIAVALTAATGPSGRLFHQLARAHMTGAATAGAIAMFIADRRATRRADTLERLRRLPVALTVPLALLILPGFIILTLGPTVASIVKQLLGGLL